MKFNILFCLFLTCMAPELMTQELGWNFPPIADINPLLTADDAKKIQETIERFCNNDSAENIDYDGDKKYFVLDYNNIGFIYISFSAVPQELIAKLDNGRYST